MGRHTQIFVAATLLMFLSVDAYARNGRENQIPNNIWGCEVCHTAAGGLNDFGFDSFDYTTGGTVNWNGLSQEDSDRDGYTNAMELGDPNNLSHPGDRMDGLCGNGTMEGAEECEGANVGDATCASMGLVSGTLSCSSMCRFDTSNCDSCGDGVLQGSEECDGADLAGNTCDSLGRGTGTLGCNGCSYDFAGCSDNSMPTPLTCGDGIRQQLEGEECDVADLAGATCATLGFPGGVLGCAVRCTFDTSGCIGGDTGSGGTPGTGGTPTGGGTTMTGGTPGQTPDVQENPDQKVELQGYACSTAPSRESRSGAALLLLVLTFVATRRRSP